MFVKVLAAMLAADAVDRQARARQHRRWVAHADRGGVDPAGATRMQSLAGERPAGSDWTSPERPR